MSKLKHTPGPWKVREIGTQNYYEIGNGRHRTADVGKESDARLIAAAPEMLECLIKKFKLRRSKFYDDPRLSGGDWRSYLKDDIELIEKATGLPIDEVLQEAK